MAELAGGTATNRRVEVVREVADRPMGSFLPDRGKDALDDIFRRVATSQVGGDVAAQRVVVSPEHRLERPAVPRPDPGDPFVDGRSRVGAARSVLGAGGMGNAKGHV